MFLRSYNSVEFGAKFDTPRHRLIAENTRSNDPFLHNAITQNADAFAPLYHWFSRSLNVLGTDPEYGEYSTMLLRPDFVKYVSQDLKRFGTGIEEIATVDIPIEAIPIPPDSLAEILSVAPSGLDVVCQIRVNNEMTRGPEIYIVRIFAEGEVAAEKIKLLHGTKGGDAVPFDLGEESQGTQRLIELLPLFFELAADPSLDRPDETVYIIDELDKSFHSALTAGLLKEYLAGCTEDTRCQLVFTTHDLSIMDGGLLRKDEMWLCEKGEDGATTLFCLGLHPGVRSDTDIMKNYREQKLGGWPKFFDLD